MSLVPKYQEGRAPMRRTVYGKLERLGWPLATRPPLHELTRGVKTISQSATVAKSQ
jgi:hypothetical protein